MGCYVPRGHCINRMPSSGTMHSGMVGPTLAKHATLALARCQLKWAVSGLHGFWTHISSEDAEALPEHLVRNYCGNCFHPALISSALGKNDMLRSWAAGGEGGPSTFVADQSETFKVFATLCDRVETEAKHRGKKEKLDIDRTLPPFHTVELRDSQQRYSHVVSEKPEVLPPLMGGCKKVRVTKTERHIQQCIDAALHKLEENQCLALRTVGLVRIFDGLRATSFILLTSVRGVVQH